MGKRELITSTVGIILIVMGLLILAIIPEASTKFFVGVLITWLGIIILGKTLNKEYFRK
jgi:hypothetical protein